MKMDCFLMNGQVLCMEAFRIMKELNRWCNRDISSEESARHISQQICHYKQQLYLQGGRMYYKNRNFLSSATEWREGT